MHDDQYDLREDRARQEAQRVVRGDEIGDRRRVAIIESDERAARRESLQLLVAEFTQRLHVRFERGAVSSGRDEARDSCPFGQVHVDVAGIEDRDDSR